jgi:hypothetical protein
MKLADTTRHSFLNDLFLEAALELLSAYGMPANVITERETTKTAGGKPNYASVLGATDEGISLVAVLMADRELLLRMHPLRNPNASEESLQDWCRELVNQLVGRAKNKLMVKCGIALQSGISKLLCDTDVRDLIMPDFTVSHNAIGVENGILLFSLATILEDETKLVEKVWSHAEKVLLEGSVTYF